MVPFCPVLPKCQTGTAAARVRKKTPRMTKPAVLMVKAAFWVLPVTAGWGPRVA